jgi:hypothetical protein
MWEHMKFKSNHNAGAAVAATLVLMLGFVGFVFVAMLVFPRSPEVPWAIAAVILVVSLLIVFVLRDRPTPSLRSAFAWVLGRRRRETGLEYEPRPLKAGPPVYGTNRPPTRDELREMKDGSTSTWVPSSAHSGRASPRHS